MPAQVTASRGDIAAYDASRAAVLGSLTGTVLEIGAGAGANFGYFRPDIRWLGLEPDPGRRRDLAAAAAAHGQHAGFRDVHARWYSRRALLGIYSPCLGGVAHV